MNEDETMQARLAALTAELESIKKQMAAPKPAAPSVKQFRKPTPGTLGGVIQREREKQGLTQTDLGKAAKLAPSNISRLEVAKSTSATGAWADMRSVVAIALALGIRTSELIRRLESEVPSMIPPSEGPPLVLDAQ